MCKAGRLYVRTFETANSGVSFFHCFKPLAWLSVAFGMWVGLESRTCSDTKLIEIGYRKGEKGRNLERSEERDWHLFAQINIHSIFNSV